MLIQPIDFFLVAWFALAAASTGYVARDRYRNIPEPAVMKWGFILVTLYMAPFGLLRYVLARRPGKWLIHRHIGHHTTNNNAEMRGGGGLMMVVDVA